MNAEVFNALGWLLVHSLWQLTAIGLLAWLFDGCMKRRSSGLRYVSLIVAMLLMAACPIATWPFVYQPATAVLDAGQDPDSRLLNDGGAIVRLPAVGGTDDSRDPQPGADANPARSAVVEVEVDNTFFTAWSLPGGMTGKAAAVIEPWFPLIVAVWCLGVFFFATRLAVGWWQIRSLLRGAARVSDERLLSLLRQAAGKLCLHRRLQLMVSHSIDSPVVIGIVRSTIIIPTSFTSGVSPEIVQAILAHELAHVRRFDYAVNLVQSVWESLFFYHPMVWWLSRRIRVERENCCDDMAATALRSPVAVGRALLAIEELRQPNLHPALSAGGSTLATRVRRLFASQPAPSRWNNAVSLIAVGLLISFLVSVAALAITRTADAEEGPDETNARYAAKFDKEKSVELIAVKRHQDDWAEGWRPDGSSLDTAIEFPKVPSNSATEDIQGFDLLFQYDGLTKSQSPVYEGEGLHTMWNRDEDGMATVILKPPDTAISTDITVGIPEAEWGPWRRVDTQGEPTEAIEVSPEYQNAYATIHVHDIQRRSESVVVRWAHDRAEEDRARMELVAVTKDGKRLTPDGSTLWDDEAGTTRSADVFRSSLGAIDYFEYRLCRIRYRVSFENVSLRPGQGTDVKIKIQQTSVPESIDTSPLPETTLPESGNVHSLRFDGESIIHSIAYGKGDAQQDRYPRIRRWSIQANEMIAEVPLDWEKAWPRFSSGLYLTEDSKLVFGSLGDELGAWDAKTGKLLRRMKPQWDSFGDLTLQNVTASPNGDRVTCTGSSNSTQILKDEHIYIWNGRTGELIREITAEASGYLRSFALSKDGQRVAAWPAMGAVGIWDVDSGQQVVKFKNENPPGSWPREPMHPSIPDQVLGLQFSHDGKTLAVGDLVGVKLVNTETGLVRQTIKAPLRYNSPVFVFSPDDRLLLRYGAYFENRQQSLLWEVQSGEQVAVLPIEGSAAAFSPGGDKLAIGRSDPRQAIAVWNLQSDGNLSNRQNLIDQSDDRQRSSSEGGTGADAKGGRRTDR